MTKVVDLTGQRFERLVVVDRAGSTRKGDALWLCRCDCGEATTVESSHLRRNHTRSCGCLDRDAKTKHGMAKHPLYSAWRGMRDRCNNRNRASYKDYGGRGITVDPRWDDFAIFVADMGPKPTDAHTLDRIDNDGPYSPANCRWATPAEQAVNRRQNRWLTFAGETMNLSAWASRFGIAPSSLGQRIARVGWEAAHTYYTERALIDSAGGAKGEPECSRIKGEK